MGIHIHIHQHLVNEDLIISKLNKIMTQIADLQAQADAVKTQIDDLQASVDAEQAQIQALLDSNAAVVTDLNTQIATLQAAIASGATADQLTAVATSLSEVSAAIVTAKADIEGTV